MLQSHPSPLPQVYDDAKSLRYGHLMIMTDQDHDGSHIKGLIMNFLHSFFPTLLKLPGFLLEFITPIVKVWGQRGRRAGREGYEDRIAEEGGRGVRGEKESGSVRRAGQRDRLAGGGGESSREGGGQGANN